MLKRYLTYIIPLFLLATTSLWSSSYIEYYTTPQNEKSTLTSPDELTISVTPSDLILELKANATEVAIFDITGREVYQAKHLVAGQLFISREKLPQAPSLLLVRVVYEGGFTKTYKVRL